MHYKYQENKKQYLINQLAFAGQETIKRSKLIQDIIIPSESLLDIRNKNRVSQFNRLVNEASYINYPQICLDNMLGMMNKGQPVVQLPQKMKQLEYYATSSNSSLKTVQNRCLESICKYGICGLKVDIKNDASINILPKIEVIEGIKIIDFKTYKDENGLDRFKFILIDESKRIFVKETKMYTKINHYKVLGLDANGEYYIAIIQNGTWGSFDLDHPENSECIELVYPEFYSRLNFIPIVIFSATSIEFNNEYNYESTSAIQPLINLSLNIFQQDANLKASLHMQANPTLFIYGSKAKPSELTLGPYAINVVQDSAAKAEYASPNFGGIQIQQTVLEKMKEEAQSLIYSILNATGNASGDALVIRLQAATLNLVSLTKNIGFAITRTLELIGEILDLNLDQIDYQPYTEFGQIKTANDIKNQVLNNKQN